jgi:class 3 adenylate cyclase
MGLGSSAAVIHRYCQIDPPTMTDAAPPIRYAKAGEVSIAYRVVGDGPLDLIWVPGLFSNLEIEWENPFYVRLYRRLASFSRFVIFDKRGMGLSDRNVGAPTLEQRMDDVRAVMDAVGSERAALIGVSEGGPMSVLFAATYPERTVALVLYGTLARHRRDTDYPYGNEEMFVPLYRIIDEEWGTGESMQVFARNLIGNERARDFVARMERAAGSPGTMRSFLDTLGAIDVRAALPTISAPTLVMHATDDHAVPIANGRFLAEHIPGARFVEIPGEHMNFDVDQFADEVEGFLTGQRHAVTTDRVLATVLFSDIVGSTERATALGDRRWRELLDQHDAIVRREVDSHQGKLIKTTGDGALATFDGPARAVTCGREIRDGVRPLGLGVRVGLHTGEIEVRGDDIGGIAVHIGARVAAMADAGEVLVSRTVTDLVAGSGLEFSDRGEHELKGVPGTWNLFAVTG